MTPTPSPTPDQFSAQALAFVPKTIEEIEQSVEVRSPIDNPEGYMEDMTKALEVMHAGILSNYDGVMIKAGGGQIGVNNDVIHFTNGANLTPIASVHFEWQNYDVPILFFPAEDSQGGLILSIIFSPTQYYENSYLIDNPAPIWTLSEFLKIFPVQLVGEGFFETMISSSFYRGDDFMTAYSIVKIQNCEDIDLVSAYWNMLGADGTYKRECELRPVVMAGGQ